MTHLSVVSLVGWNFLLSYGRPGRALPILLGGAFALRIGRGIRRIATAFAQTLRDLDTLIYASRQLPAECGAAHREGPVLA